MPAPIPVPVPTPPLATPATLTVIEGSAPRRTPLAEPAAEPVHAMQARLGAPAAGAAVTTAATTAATRHPQAAAIPGRPEDAHDVILASAVYVTGSRGLQAGSRYGIALIGPNLGILGPVDVDPTAIAIVRPLRGLDANGIQGQLIITAAEGSRDRFALVFMSVAGGTPEGVAEVIAAAAATKTAAAQ